MKTEYTVAKQISNTFSAYINCLEKDNQDNNTQEWTIKHRETLEWIEKQFLPSGSGFDNGTRIDMESTKPGKLVFTTGFHHMGENGMYDGWTYHSIIVRPTFNGFSLKVTGQNKNNIKEYIAEQFHYALSAICHIVDYEKQTNEFGYYFNDEWHAKD